MASASLRARAGAAATLVGALLWWGSAPALAHGGQFPDQAYYRSAVTAVEPRVPGLEIAVHGGGESLTLTNHTGGTVTVLSYSGEPYLRITDTGVEENLNSLSSMLNGDRVSGDRVSGDLDIRGLSPASAASARRGPPVWQHVADVPAFTWHDHRIHWMTQQRPPAVAADPTHPQRVFDWAIQLSVDDRPVTVLGSVTWVGAPSVGSHLVLWLGGGALVAAAGAVAVGLLGVSQGGSSERRGRRARRESVRAGNRSAPWID